MKKRGICLLPDACYLSELNVPGKPNRTNLGNRAASILNFKFSSAHLILSRSEVVELLFAFSLCFGDKLSLYRSSIYCLSAIFQLYL